jgi:hypothetical protein
MLRSHNVAIYHAMPMFRPFDPESSILSLAYSYETTALDLEQIWRWNNVVDGTEAELPVKHKKRSLSVGDVVGIRHRDGTTTYHEVKGSGWERVDPDQVDRALERWKEWDPFEGL